jgi:elongator complex protein 1
MMRNLSLSSSEIISFSGANICATAIDLDQNVLYAASEHQNLDNDVEVEIWKVGLDKTDGLAQVSMPRLLL